MSKNKKLGRGITDLLEQKRQQEEEEKRRLEQEAERMKTTVSSADGNAEIREPQRFGEGKAESSADSMESADDDQPFQYSRPGIFSDVSDAAFETEEIAVSGNEKNGTFLEEGKPAVFDLKASDGPAPKTLMDFVPEEERDAIPGRPQSAPVSPVSGNAESAAESAAVDRIYNISVSLVDSNPWQPREIFQAKEIAELAESIRIHGLLQPIVVREVKNRYQLIAGERRFRAAMKLNWTQVPVTIVDATDREMAELALIENIQRKDLNPIEKAVSFQKYLEENHCTQEELARRLQIDRSTISNLVRLLSLPEEIQQMVTEEKLTQGHARSLLSLTTTQDQTAMAHRIADEKLSVRQTEQIVSDWKAKPIAERRQESIARVPAPAGKEKKEKSAYILDLERQLQDALDLKVKITANSAGKGKLEIFFNTNEDFSSLMDYFR